MEQLVAALYGSIVGILGWILKALYKIHRRLETIEKKLFGNGKGDPQ